MKFKLTFITGVSLMLLATGLYVALTDPAGYASKRTLLILLGILGGAIGNQLAGLEERLSELEKSHEAEQAGKPETPKA